MRDPTRPDAGSTRFRPSTRRRNRIAAGVALGAIAIGGNVLLYTSLDDSDSVLQAVRDIPAGEQVTADMVREVDLQLDDSVQAVPAGEIGAVIGQYAKVRIVAGSLVVSPALQSQPLVADGNSIVAIEISEGLLPAGLRERVPVQLVVPARASTPGEDSEPLVVTGRVVGLPTSTDSALDVRSLSVEVPARDGPTIAAADDVRVVLLEPRVDPATDEATSNGDGSAPSAEPVSGDEES